MMRHTTTREFLFGCIINLYHFILRDATSERCSQAKQHLTPRRQRRRDLRACLPYESH